MTKIAILILSIAGFIVANKIRLEKKSGKKIVCPIDGKCETVLGSKYAYFIGLPLQYVGMFYYLFLISSYIVFIIKPEIQDSILGLSVFVSTIFGFLFSFYLFIIQWKVIKSWCTWCLYSAFISTMIFFASFSSFLKEIDLSILVSKNFNLIHNFDVLLIAFATSTVFVTEIINFKFLKDFKISEKESNIILMLWQLIWSLIFATFTTTYLILISENMLYITIPSIREVILIIILILSAISSFWLLPKIHKASNTNTVNVKKIITYRILVLTIGSILVGSWFLLPATNREIYFYTNISLVIFSNLLLFYLDRKNLNS